MEEVFCKVLGISGSRNVRNLDFTAVIPATNSTEKRISKTMALYYCGMHIPLSDDEHRFLQKVHLARADGHW